MDTWTLPELVAEVAARISVLPAPKNGQVRAVPDERTVRYYGTIGLLDRPVSMRGRTALYGRRHLAQVVAIKRLQTTGRSLAEIQALWPTLDDGTLARMSGVTLPRASRAPARTDVVAPPASPTLPPPPAASALPRGPARVSRPEFWKREPAAIPLPSTARASAPASADAASASAPALAPVELRIELAPDVVLAIAMPEDGVALSSADLRAIRAAAAPLVTELARRQLTPHAGEEEP